jgi:hypothetical protein
VTVRRAARRALGARGDQPKESPTPPDAPAHAVMPDDGGRGEDEVW